MRQTIETLTTSKQVSKDNATFVKDCNCIIRRNYEWNCYNYKVTNSSNELRKFKTFESALNYMYNI